MTRLHALTENPRVVFTQLEAIKAGKPGFYPGVLILEKGAAKGHFAVKESDGRVVNCDWNNPEHATMQKYPIVMGDAMLDDVVRCGMESETTKAKMDHGSTVRDIFGDYSNFKRDGDQVRADLTLMNSTPHREYVEELFAKFAKKVGNSIDFNYQYEIQGDVAVSRCKKLNSVDIVDAPAATNSLFHENNPTPIPKHMPLDKADLDAIKGVVASEVETRFTALETGINTRFGKIETKLEEGDKKGEEDDEKKKKDKEDKSEMSKTEMRAMIETATLSAVQKILPKVAIENLTSLAAKAEGNDEYDTKHAALVASGVPTGQATRFMANKHPQLYTAKFGAGGGQKGSAKV